MSVTRIYRYVCCHKITIDLLYFWDVYDAIMVQSIKYLFAFDWLTLYLLFEKFLCFSESGIIASSSSWLKV